MQHARTCCARGCADAIQHFAEDEAPEIGRSESRCPRSLRKGPVQVVHMQGRPLHETTACTKIPRHLVPVIVPATRIETWQGDVASHQPSWLEPR